jgi:hypothetical protein
MFLGFWVTEPCAAAKLKTRNFRELCIQERLAPLALASQ